MASIDYTVTVSVSGDSPPVNAANFGVVLVLSDQGDLPGGFTERYRSYSSAAALAADADVDTVTKAAANAAFAQNPRVTTVAIGRCDALEDEDDALDAIEAENSNFYAVCPVNRTKANLLLVAGWVETRDKVALLQSSDADMLTGALSSLAWTLQNLSRQNSMAIYHATDTEHVNVAIASKTLQADPDVVTTTAAHKTLSGVAPSVLTDTERDNLFDEGGNVYGSNRGQGDFYPGKMSNGDFFDVRLTMHWVKARTAERITQLFLNLSNQNRKVPYNDGGIQQVGAQVRAVLQQGVNAGHFNDGQWRVNLPARADVPPADVQNRVLNFDFEAELAGAVQEVNLIGYVVTNLSA